MIDKLEREERKQQKILDKIAVQGKVLRCSVCGKGGTLYKVDKEYRCRFCKDVKNIPVRKV
jgi:rubrerythrin